MRAFLSTFILALTLSGCCRECPPPAPEPGCELPPAPPEIEAPNASSESESSSGEPVIQSPITN